MILGLLQGFSELFPFSSLGLLTIFPSLVHWHLDQSAPSYLPFVVTLHVGTAVALIIYFRRDWIQLWQGLVRGFQGKWEGDGLLARYLILATIPAGLVGLAFEHKLKALFATPLVAATLLMVNGLIMLIGEKWFKPGRQHLPVERLGNGRAFGIGLSQILAFFPGISRSGVTMVGGLAAGLEHESAARFSFLMATPIILAAGLFEIRKLHGHTAMLGLSLVGGLVAGITAYLSTRYLMHYFRRGNLLVFAAISFTIGLISLALIS